MKKRILLLLAICVAVILPSCQSDKDEPVGGSVEPIRLYFMVYNKAGQNLLDPKVEGNILNKKMQLRMNGQTSNIALSKPSNVSNGKGVHWYGAYIGSPTDEVLHNEIIIGEFAADKNYKQRLTLYLGGEIYEVEFVNTYCKYDGKPVVSRKYYLNGRESGGDGLLGGDPNSIWSFGICLDR